MLYINRQGQGYRETVDEVFATNTYTPYEAVKSLHNNAVKLVREYRLADPSARYWVSTRACKGWKEKHEA